MAGKHSAGILMYRFREQRLEVLLVHPGGPFWAHKDDGAWSIPKGELQGNEDPLEAARREFFEETGLRVERVQHELAPLRQPSGKVVHAWIASGDFDPEAIRSNTFAMEWPPGSGKRAEFPEVDRAGWFAVPEARAKLLRGQVPFLDQLCAILAAPPPAGTDERERPDRSAAGS